MTARAALIAIIVAACALAAWCLFGVMQDPDGRVTYAVLFAGCVLVLAIALYVMPERKD